MLCSANGGGQLKRRCPPYMAFASLEAQSTFTGKITYTIYYSYISHTGKIPRLPLNLKTFRLRQEQVAQVYKGCVSSWFLHFKDVEN